MEIAPTRLLADRDGRPSIFSTCQALGEPFGLVIHRQRLPQLTEGMQDANVNDTKALSAGSHHRADIHTTVVAQQEVRRLTPKLVAAKRGRRMLHKFQGAGRIRSSQSSVRATKTALACPKYPVRWRHGRAIAKPNRSTVTRTLMQLQRTHKSVSCFANAPV